MKITKIQIDRLAVPLIHPYHLSKEYGTFATATPVLVTLYTDEGIVGYGECDPWPLFTGDSAEVSTLILEKHLAPTPPISMNCTAVWMPSSAISI